MFDFIQSFLEEVGIGLGAFIIALVIWIKDIFDKRIAVEHQKEIDKLKTILQEKEHYVNRKKYETFLQQIDNDIENIKNHINNKSLE